MKRLMVSMDDEVYEALRRIAFQKNTQMAKLIRFAIDKTFEDDLDSTIGDMRLKEHLEDSSGAVTIQQLMEEFGIGVPRRTAPRSKERTRRATG